MGEGTAVRRQSGALLALDTSSEAARVQVALWRQMSPLEKARLVAGASASVRQLAMSGIQLRHPAATAEECRLRYAVRTLGRSLASRAYPEAAALGAP